MKLLIDNKNKGFTLVEVIVVLVIIGVLMSIAVPSLTGYIDTSSDKKVIAECQSVVTAARTMASQDLATGTPVTSAISAKASFRKDVYNMSGVPESSKVEYLTFTDAILTDALYFNDGKYVHYKDGDFNVVSNEEAARLIAANYVAPPADPPVIPPAPSAPTNGFSDVRGITDDEAKQLAIAENGKTLLEIFNSLFIAQIGNFAPEGADTWSKGNMKIGGNPQSKCTFYKDGVIVGAQNAETIEFPLTIFNEYFAENGINGATLYAEQANVFFEKIPGTSLYSTTPSYVEFKNWALTGGTSSNELWKYYADGRLEFSGNK